MKVQHLLRLLVVLAVALTLGACTQPGGPGASVPAGSPSAPAASSAPSPAGSYDYGY